MSEVFDTTPENILMHLKNIFRDAKLDECSTAKDFLAVQTEGKRQVERNLKHYNLDAIISVGYRVSSNGHGRVAPLIMKLAMPVSPTPSLPRKREREIGSRLREFHVKRAVQFRQYASRKDFTSYTPKQDAHN